MMNIWLDALKLELKYWRTLALVSLMVNMALLALLIWVLR
jgi:hypothetical protein